MIWMPPAWDENRVAERGLLQAEAWNLKRRLTLCVAKRCQQLKILTSETGRSVALLTRHASTD